MKRLNFKDRYRNTKYNTFGIHMKNVSMFLEEPEKLVFDTRMGVIRGFISCNSFCHHEYLKMGFKLQGENQDKYRFWLGENFLEFSRFSDL